MEIDGIQKSRQALLICDMLNTFNFAEAKELLPAAAKAAKVLAQLKKSLKALGIPAVYVNDNFGLWRSDWTEIWQACTAEGRPGKEIAEALKPEKEDYFILKPKHSGFHFTSLQILLEKMEVEELIITGIAGNICVLFTAHDAHMLEYKVSLPRDCIASNTEADTLFALNQLKQNFQMDTPLSDSLITKFRAELS